MQKQILEYFQKQNKPLSLREMMRQLRLDKYEAKEALELLEAEGQIVQIRRQLYQLPQAQTQKGFEGRVQAHPAGFAFVIPNNPDLPDMYIPKGYLGGAWHGDLVRAEAKPPGRDRRPWGVIVEVKERGNPRLAGQLYFRKGLGWIKPDDQRLPSLKLSPMGLEGLEQGSRITVKVIYPEKKSGKAEPHPYGELLAFLGIGDSPEVETEAVIAKYDLPTEFSPEALAEAEQVAKLGPDKHASFEPGKRTDFRSLRVFTIDGIDAKDFDDAIHLQTLPNGNFEVGIHIADVSHYVKEFSPLDHDAYQRATSAYLPGRVLPMLPENLSNGICSLKPGEDRLVLSVLVELTPSGRVKGYKFHEGIIRSVARLTYNQVEAFAETGALPPTPETLSPIPELQADLQALLALTHTLKQRRLEEGALDFHFTEVKVEVDAEGNLHLIPQAEPRARSLIEELMLLANRTVAKHLSERGIPALFRVHEDPSEEQFNKLLTALGKMGYSLPGGELSPKALQNLLAQSQGKPEAPAVSVLLLRSLRLARYAAENLGHFGLAAEHYLHFTSPIRRYPDLVVHRVLRTLMRRKITQERKDDWAKRFPKLAKHTSERERAAENAERELTKYYQALWAEKHKGEIATGTVTGVTNFGVFVGLVNGVEGMVRLGALEDDHYQYLEDLLALEGTRTKRRIRIGDSLEIKIVGANPAARQIDFAPTEKFYGQPKASHPTSRGPRAKSKNSRVAGPPEQDKGFKKPVKATARKIYFGAWSDENTAPSEPAPATPKRGKQRKRRK